MRPWARPLREEDTAMRTTRYVSKIRGVVKREQPGRRPIAPRSLRLVALTPLSGASRLPPPRPAIARQVAGGGRAGARGDQDRKSTRLNSSPGYTSYALLGVQTCALPILIPGGRRII